MRRVWLIVASLILAAHAGAAHSQDPAIQVDFSNPQLSPPHWTIVLHPDGSGHFRSEMEQAPKGGWKEIQTPSIDRDIRVSREYASHVFDTAIRHNWFNQPCESHLKVAFQGWKTLTYTGHQGQGSCTFNYSRDREIQGLGDSILAVAETILEGARLETLLQHDPLGLDQEMEFLTEAVADGQAQQIGAISSILERLAQDDDVLERVRRQARSLLAHGSI